MTGLVILIVLLATLLVVLIQRRSSQRHKHRLSPVRFCENCGKKIHRQERTFYWHGAHVCLDCRKRLGDKGDAA